MRQERVFVPWDEFAAVRKLLAEHPAHDAKYRVELRRILGDWMVNRMEKFAAEEPTEFVLWSTEQVRHEEKITL